MDGSLLSAITVNDSTRCKRCHKRAALFCTLCDGTPPQEPDTKPVTKTYYCSRSCSRKDWNQTGPVNHKTLCLRLNQRRYLYRAAATAQQVFIYLQMAKLDQIILDSFILDGYFGFSWTPSELGEFADFPYDIVPGVRDTLRVLTHRRADEALVYTYNFAAKLLHEHCSKVVEIAFTAKGLKGRPMFSNDPLPFHAVNYAYDRQTMKALKITLSAQGDNAEENYIWNLVGPEDNFYDPISDWDIFRAKHVLGEPTIFEFGRQRRLWDHFDFSDSADTPLKMLTTLTRCSHGEMHQEFRERLIDAQRKFRHFIQAFDRSILSAESASGLQVVDALNLSEHEYVAWKLKFLGAFRSDIMEARVPKLKEKAGK